MGSLGEIIRWTLNASSIILIVFLLEFTLGRKMKKTYHCALWGIVLIRLLFPNMPSSSWSLLNVFPQNQQSISDTRRQLGKAQNLQALMPYQDEAVLLNEIVAEEGYNEADLDNNNMSADGKAANNSTQRYMIRNNTFQSNELFSNNVLNNGLFSNNIFSNDLLSSALQSKGLVGKESNEISKILYIIWLAGVLGLGSYWMIGYIQAKRKIQKLNEISDEAVLKLFEDCKERVIRQHKGKNIKLAEGQYAMIFGMLKPVITLPKDKRKEELEIILLHELTHYRYKDYLLTYVQLIALSLHWFNPLVWLAVKQMKADIEYACDERVITLGISKKHYANALLNMMHQEKAGSKVMPYMQASAFAQGMGGGVNEAKHRIKKIAGMKKSRLMGSLLSLILVSFLTVGCLTDAPAKVEETGAANQENTSTQVEQEAAKIQNIAVLGLDSSGARADTIFVGSINEEEGSLKITSIPRDTKIVLDDTEREQIKAQGMTCPEVCKLSELGAYSGKLLIEEIVLKEIEKLAGLKIDHYIFINIETAEKMIDAMGGLEVNVPQTMSYDDNEQDLHIHLEAGMQYLTGDQVMGAVMFRHSTDYAAAYPDGDIGRVKMTQSILKSIWQKIKDFSSAEEFIKVAQGVSASIETNLPLSNLLTYYNLLGTIKAEGVQFDIVPGETVSENGRFYYIVEESKEAINVN